MLLSSHLVCKVYHNCLPNRPKILFLTVHLDRASVDAFHATAVAAGGKDHGAPGFRPQIHPNYYGAFVLDPLGNNIEAGYMAPSDQGEL